MSDLTPKLMFYADKAMTKPLTALDFGEVDVDESAERTVYVINFGERDLTKIKVNTLNPDLKVSESPTEIKAGKTTTMKLSWTPKSGKPLFENIEILGKFKKS